MRRAVAFVAAAFVSSAALANWTASGRFVYEDREWNATGFTGTNGTKPIRFADVEVIDPTKSGSKQILAKAKTDANGDFSIAVVDSTTRSRVAVRVYTRTNNTSDLFVKVTNQSGSVYAGQTADDVAGLHGLARLAGDDVAGLDRVAVADHEQGADRKLEHGLGDGTRTLLGRAVRVAD